MFFKKKKYITINNPQKSRKNYDLTYDNLAIPEIHTGKKKNEPPANEDTQDSDSKHIDTQYENMAIPEIHIHRHKQ